MDFEFNDEQTMFRNMAREFAEREIIPSAAEDDQNDRYRPDITQKLAALGLLGAPSSSAQKGSNGIIIPNSNKSINVVRNKTPIARF